MTLPRLSSSKRFASLFAMFAVAMTMCGSALAQLRISQVYGGGGNSGATLKNDFIEIFNAGSAGVSLNGYSVQYASSTGSSWQVTSLSNVTLQAGQYYLIQESQGAGGTTDLPAADVAGLIAMSATAGKVALVSSTAALSGACPTATVVDMVGFGTATNCSEGTPVGALSNTTAAIRNGGGCTDTSNNSADFTVAAPNPRNTSSTLNVCTSTGAVGVTAQATPSSVLTGSSTLLTATVTPGSSPASTNLAVSANLLSAGGSSTQPLLDDGQNGDVAAGDNIFSYRFTPTIGGSLTLPVTVSDAQLRTASANIALSVTAPPAFVSIRTIQANKPSTYATQTVTTSGIIVGVKSNGFYLEAKDADTHPVTPEGILVFKGSNTFPAFIQVGNEVSVTGTVATFPAAALTPATELSGTQTYTLLTTGNALPAPVTITAAMDSPSGGVKQFTPYEGMRVAIGSVTTTSGTDAVLAEATETNVSNGEFYGVVTGVPRPFVEPGIAVNDTAYGPIPAGVTIWDANPEVLLFDSLAFGRPAINLTSKATVTGITGVMDFSTGGPDVLIDATAAPVVTGLMTVTPVPAAAANEFTVASFNMERFYNDKQDQDNPGSSVVTVTTEAYQRRLAKVSLAVRNVLNFPDVVGAEEIENIAVLSDVAAKISADAIAAGQPDPKYAAYLFLANDGTGINTGLLAKTTRVDVTSVTQVGLTTTFTNSVGSQAILNDRTPLVARLGIKRSGGQPDYPVTVVVVHQRSLNGIDDPSTTGQTVRIKREKQAEYLATLIQGLQSSGEKVITVGDYNGFQFSDGFVDVLGVTRGDPVPASQVIVPPVAGLANPPLVDLVNLLPAEERQSYVFNGNAQVLDHIVVTSDLVPTETRLVYAHLDSDFPLVLLNDATSPSRVSDHDPAVAYFTVPDAVVAGTVQLVTTSVLTKISGGYQAVLTVKNNGTGTAQNVQVTSATLGTAAGSPAPQALGNIAPNGGTATVTVTFPTAGASGTEKIAGSYTGGAFSASFRVSLPQ